jgi:prepilin-type N-terminal cleavage/methylation domain-containing protein
MRVTALLHRFPRGRRISDCRGFTLLEMMVVVTLAALMLSLAVPSFRDLIVGQRVKTAAFAFANAALQARSEAIKRNQQVALVPLVVGNWGGGWQIRIVSGAVLLSQQDAFPGVVIASVAPKVTASQVLYEANGRLGAAVDELRASDEAGGHARCLSFDLSGLPKSRLGSCL